MDNRYLKRIAVSMVLGTTLIAGASCAAKSPRKTQLDDSWLTAKTKISLAADSRVEGHQVSVETRKGVVTLRGKVDSDNSKVAAREIASAIDGVRRVDNELQVVAPEKRDSVQESDEVITAKVKAQITKDAMLMKDSRLKKADIGVVTNAGVVSLTGEVENVIISAQASWTTWQVAGVRSVKNDLVLKAK